MKHRPIPKKHVNYDLQYSPYTTEPSLIMAAQIYFAIHGSPPPEGWTLEDAKALMIERHAIIGG